MLINPSYPIGGRNVGIPLGIASIAAELEKNGYEGQVTLVDGCYLSKRYGLEQSFDRIEKEIELKKPFVVGCSLHYGTFDETEIISLYALNAGSHVMLGGMLRLRITSQLQKTFTD